VGQNEETPSEMGRADFERRKQACFDAKAHAAKVLEDLGGSHTEVTFDVFEEAPFRVDFADDPGDVRPEMAGVFPAALQACEGKRLAGVSASDERNLATPRAAIEGFDIVPDRRVIQGLVRHPRHEGGRGEGFPLDETNSAVSGFCDVEAELQSANACAEGKSGESGFMSGMYSHTSSSLIDAPGVRSRARLASDG
jgi:hypothetical protein